MKSLFGLFFVGIFALTSFGENSSNVVEHLQNVSVMVKAGEHSGSGVIITRSLKDSKNEVKNVNMIITAAHVLDSLRSTRTVIDNGQEKKLVEFKDASIVQEILDSGRKVGNLELDCKVIKYSDADNGEDIAILMVRKLDFVNVDTKFHLGEPEVVPIGTATFHVGSVLGTLGQQMCTNGIISQVGRPLDVGGNENKLFDFCNNFAGAGSSGGPIFMAENGVYLGMVTRGVGQIGSFTIFTPIRRIKEWAKENKIEWILDPQKETPTLEELKSLPIEDVNFQIKSEKASS